MTTPPVSPARSHAPHDDALCRQDRLRLFLDAHGLSLPDVGEALSDLSPTGYFDRNQVFTMLYVNKRMKQPIRDRLLDLGFPEDTLPPARPLPCFPGRRAAGMSTTA